MGTPMAINLVKTGHEVGVWNRSSDKTKPVVDAGASAYPSKEMILKKMFFYRATITPSFRSVTNGAGD